MSRIFLHSILLLTFVAQVEGQNTTMFRKQAYKHASVGICVFDKSTSKMLCASNADQSLEPASVAKLVTTAAALEILGPNHRFETKLEYSGQIEHGVLTGDIRIRGGGDPSLGSHYVNKKQDSFLDEWVEAVRKAGIQEIKGKIISDAGIFNDEPVSPYWLWEDMGNYYAAGIYGLAVFDNSFELGLRSGRAGTRPEIISVQPPLRKLTIDNHLVAANNDLDSAYLYGAPYQWDRRLFGTMPEDRSRFIIKGDIPDPPGYLAERFKEELVRHGIPVSGEALSARQLPAAEQDSSLQTKVFHTTYSIPLSQMIRIIHEHSDNLYTEYLLRHLALTVSDKPASARDGLQVVRDYWKNKGLDVSALYLSDACGLSPNDRISARFLTQLLLYMSTKSKYQSIFEASLPLAGVEGSVSGFLKGTALEGKIRLKSGSLQTVTSYAGYYKLNGKSYVIVMMVNYADASRSQIRKDMEEFLLML